MQIIETEKTRIKELSKSIKPVKSAYFKKYNRSRSRSSVLVSPSAVG